MDYRQLCEDTIDIVKKAGNYILDQHNSGRNTDIREKGKHDYVTHVDRTAEKMLVEDLGNLLPSAGFIAEEGTSSKSGDRYHWIIDPLDGTTNFIHGVFPFAVSVALTEDQVPVLGVILEMGAGECFYAWKGGRAWLNGNPIGVSTAANLNQSLIATGFPYSDYGRIGAFMDSLEWFMKHSQGLRRLGSAATDIAYVACGRYDGFYEYGLHPWDIAAGVIILGEAGGRTTDFEGADNFLFGEEIICSNGRIHDEFTNAVKRIMTEE